MAWTISCIAIVIVAIQFIAKVLPWIYENIVGPWCLGPKFKLREYGEWALVTGATDGIGKSYAKELARQGINIILISRTQAKLKKVAAEIEKDYGVRTKVIAIDFNGGLDIYENIASEINGFNIGILVNNVGTSYPYPELFLDVADRDTTFEQILRCNIASVVHMTKVLLPHMISNKKGIILNISSISGSIPQPMLAVYSASKAFVDKFSEDINTEYASHGIIVQAVLPGFVVTNMTKLRSARLLHPNADQYVTSAMRSIGYARHTTGYIPHALMRLMLRTSHEYIPTATNTITLFIMKKIKKISLRLNEKFEEDQKLKEKSH